MENHILGALVKFVAARPTTRAVGVQGPNHPTALPFTLPRTETMYPYPIKSQCWSSPLGWDWPAHPTRFSK